eukprot:TRINITY_DN614_c1_g1_i1.p1 TRINITY_DN614_c1_g1~~TRINITY_DN614_c1_g1_i1.p1  ORF type:complete len:741 (+),score=179.12 TRINITY_DN614_c1_g1_i1:234-2456(+)
MASFASGLLVGGSTKTKRVGFVLPIPISGVLINLNMIYLGVQMGAGGIVNNTHVEHVVDVLFIEINSFHDFAKAREAAMRLHKLGCDVLMHNTDDPTVDMYAKENGLLSVGQFNNMRQIVGESVLTSVDNNWAPLFSRVLNLSYTGDLAKSTTNRNPDLYGYQEGGPVSHEPSFAATEGSVAMFHDTIARMKNGSFEPGCLGAFRKGVLYNPNRCLSVAELASFTFLIDGPIDVYNGSTLQLPSEQCGQGKRHTVRVVHDPPTYEVTCITCTPGTYALAAGATECTVCPAGMFSGAGSPNCSECPQGTWSAAGSMNCTACAGGSTNSGTGNSGCPVELEEADYTVAIALASVFGGLLFIAAPIVILKVRSDRAKMNELYSEKAIAQKCADSIADMHLEEVDYIRHIERPTAIIQALIVIMDNLKEYRRYLPQTLLAERQSGDEDSPSDCGVPRQRGSHFSSTSASSASRLQDANSSADSKCVVVNNGVARREATVVVINLVGFMDLFSRRDNHSAVMTHSTVAEKLLKIFDETRGASETFTGDRFVATYNTVRSIASHRAMGCKALLLLQAASSDLGVQFSSSCTSGVLRCGTVGCDRMKRFTFFGTCATWAFALERLCKAAGAPNLVGPSLRHESARFEMFAVDSAQFLKYTSEDMTVSTVTSERELANEEWMYQLELSNSDRDVLWNNWAAAVMRSDWEAGTGLWRAAESVMPADKWFRRLVEAFESRTFSPATILYH